MKDFFKPEDFTRVVYSFYAEIIADQANEKLNALIESCPVVFNYNEGLSSWWNPKEMSFKTDDTPVRKARLAFIEEIVKEPCKHEPVFSKERVSAMMHNFDDESEFYRAATYGATIHHNVSARLIDIQEIKKKCEKHEPMGVYENNRRVDGAFKMKCTICGVELMADWREKT